jgi:hypothetical protein
VVLTPTMAQVPVPDSPEQVCIVFPEGFPEYAAFGCGERSCGVGERLFEKYAGCAGCGVDQYGVEGEMGEWNLCYWRRCVEDASCSIPPPACTPWEDRPAGGYVSCGAGICNNDKSYQTRNCGFEVEWRCTDSPIHHNHIAGTYEDQGCGDGIHCRPDERQFRLIEPSLCPGPRISYECYDDVSCRLRVRPGPVFTSTLEGLYPLYPRDSIGQ